MRVIAGSRFRSSGCTSKIPRANRATLQLRLRRRCVPGLHVALRYFDGAQQKPNEVRVRHVEPVGWVVGQALANRVSHRLEGEPARDVFAEVALRVDRSAARPGSRLPDAPLDRVGAGELPQSILGLRRFCRRGIAARSARRPVGRGPVAALAAESDRLLDRSYSREQLIFQVDELVERFLTEVLPINLVARLLEVARDFGLSA